jgi:hypothetical protein
MTSMPLRSKACSNLLRQHHTAVTTRLLPRNVEVEGAGPPDVTGRS